MAMHLLGIDVEGAFTDLALLDEATGAVAAAKAPSTPANQAEGLLSGLQALLAPLESLQIIVHGATVATNAVLERPGAVCGRTPMA